MSQLVVCIGILAALLVNVALPATSWRTMFGLATIPSVILALGAPGWQLQGPMGARHAWLPPFASQHLSCRAAVPGPHAPAAAVVAPAAPAACLRSASRTPAPDLTCCLPGISDLGMDET